MTQGERREYLIRELLLENQQYKHLTIPESAEEQQHLLRALMNVRRAKPVSEQFLDMQNEYLQQEIQTKGITNVEDLTPVRHGLYIWQGDITTLKCDAIVNAANSGMTGCYVPNHRCIDNAIHTYAGVQLRLECAQIIKKKGMEEPTGGAELTKAYNLPCRYILHTVGPIVFGALTSKDCELLAACYLSCLTLAAEKGLESVAFCCISTGEFHFPNRKAAEIAVCTVRNFMQKNTSVKKVVFNVFKDEDREIYEELLR